MLSILLKRQAKAKRAQDEKVKTENVTIAPAGSIVNKTRLALLDKPWDETQSMLKQDLSRLRTLAGSQEKEPYKKELVKKYRPLVIKLESSHDNLDGLDVVWWFYQWQVDIGLLPLVHGRLKDAVFKGLETPHNWKANGQTTFCDIVFKYSHNAYANKADFCREYLIDAVQGLLEGKLATNAPLKVKMFRLVGDWYFDDGENEKAYHLFDLVMKLDPKKGGRKTKLNDLKEELGYGDPH
ncbi:phage terminase small subunit [Vibrio sp. DW001]|uniref:phage terminase small subunit n=1 Tax=Vibrio sp. DW001 TaxID=2912315 RepID=UPI0023AFB758|nr:phage terminase small subunit [Vibrio sp. DW001]WED29866.1 phage terminase small subunit [Vibrio sp. DW001]